MPRKARIVAVGVAHHITQRGNNREPVFERAGDRRMYLDLLRRYSAKYEMRILGYCLMTNHIHLVAIPAREDSLARSLARTHGEYAAHWNRREQRTGHLWQGRYFSCPLDQIHVMRALRYVEQNPIRAGLVQDACQWAWSSARAHTDDSIQDTLLDGGWADYLGDWNYTEWHDLLHDSNMRHWQDLRRSTLTGVPMGSTEFVDRIEALAGRKLRVSQAGRPRKTNS